MHTHTHSHTHTDTHVNNLGNEVSGSEEAPSPLSPLKWIREMYNKQKQMADNFADVVVAVAAAPAVCFVVVVSVFFVRCLPSETKNARK